MILPWCLLNLFVTLTGTWALQCYNFERVFTGRFDLSHIMMPIMTCAPDQEACLEAVSSISTGYRNSLTLVKKGCSKGSDSGEMISTGNSLPPDYTLVQRCQQNLCNQQIENHDNIPNLSPAPDPPELSGTECWACVSSTDEGCKKNAYKVKCHGDQSVCYQGQGTLMVENFSTHVYLRTCHNPSCTYTGAATHWSDNFLKGKCCKGNFCNLPLAIPKPPSSLAPKLLALPLLLTISLLLSI